MFVKREEVTSDYIFDKDCRCLVVDSGFIFSTRRDSLNRFDLKGDFLLSLRPGDIVDTLDFFIHRQIDDLNIPEAPFGKPYRLSRINGVLYAGYSRSTFNGELDIELFKKLCGEFDDDIIVSADLERPFVIGDVCKYNGKVSYLSNNKFSPGCEGFDLEKFKNMLSVAEVKYISQGVLYMGFKYSDVDKIEDFDGEVKMSHDYLWLEIKLWNERGVR